MLMWIDNKSTIFKGLSFERLNIDIMSSFIYDLKYFPTSHNSPQENVKCYALAD